MSAISDNELLEYLRENRRYQNESKQKYYKRIAPLLGYSAGGIKKKIVTKNLWYRVELTTTKVTTNAKGEKTTVESLRDLSGTSNEGLVLVGKTTNPNGGEWKKYKSLIDWDSIMSGLKEKLQGIEIPLIPIRDIEYSNHVAIVNVYDAHLDKLVVKPRSGVGSLQDNIDVLNDEFNNILAALIEKKPKKIIFPIGSDLFHTNWFNNKTKKGTELEYYCNPEIAYEEICGWIVEKIMQLASITEDLVVVPIKGNHDEDKVVTMKVWLDITFKKSENITVINEIPMKQRIVIKEGINLLGFGHGDKEKKMIGKIPLLMATEYPREWADTKRRHFYCGDLHHEFEYKFLSSKDFPGSKVEFLRSCGVDDQYHKDHGWLGVPKTMYVDYWPLGFGVKTRDEYEVHNNAA